MARFDSPLTILVILVVARVQTIMLDDYGELDDSGNMPQSDYSDFSSPSAPVESFLASHHWPSDNVNIGKRVPSSSLSHAFDENEFEEPETKRKRPVSKRRSRRTDARAVTQNELYQLFGETPRRKKSSGQMEKSSLFRTILKSALQRKHIPVKRKRSVHGKKLMVKKSDERQKRALKDEKEEAEEQSEAEKQENDDDEEEGRKILTKLELTNALLNKENSFLTAALNEATVAQTIGNDEDTIRKEVENIKNAEKVEAIMRQLEQDDAAMKAANHSPGSSEEPDDVEETVMVTDTSFADLTKCPVVKKLSTQCSSVSQNFNFNMDKDAYDACDAHKICYGCSFAFSSNRDLCDRLFLAQSRILCSREKDNQQCGAEARALLQAMQAIHPIEVEDMDDVLERECRNPCVRAYFKGVYRSRR